MPLSLKQKMKQYFVKKFMNQSSFIIDDADEVVESAKKKHVDPKARRLYGILGVTPLLREDENQSFVQKKYELTHSFDHYKIKPSLLTS